MFDLIVIGAGPGGYTSAIKASQLGLKVLLIEKESLGGTCLNNGCIPTKIMLHASSFLDKSKKINKYGINFENLYFDYETLKTHREKTVSKINKSLSNLVKSYDIEVLQGQASFNSKNSILVEDKEYFGKNIILATGSKPKELSNLKFDGVNILSSDDILNLDKLPEDIVIAGSGAIGIEWARIFSGFGVKVNVVEAMQNISPRMDESVCLKTERLLKKKRITVFKDTYIEKFENKTAYLSNGKEIEADFVLLAVGREVSFERLNLQKAGVEVNDKGLILDKNLKTTNNNIYAIGDITNKNMLAHVASHQAVAVVENIVNNKSVDINYDAIPNIIYGHPEIACVGKVEQELLGKDYKKSEFPVSALGRAQADDEIDGVVKVLAVDEKIVGASIISSQADSLIHIFSLAIQNELGVEGLKECVYAHPTYTEGIFESLLGLDDISLHLPKV